MVSVEAYFYYIDYSIVNSKAVIYMYGRDKEGHKVVIRDRNFRPYFIIEISGVNEKEINEEKESSVFSDSIKKIMNFHYLSNAYPTSVEVVRLKQGLEYKEYLKVYVNLPSSVRKVKEIIKASLKNYYKSYEKDILYVRRYLIDNDLYPLTYYQFEGDFINFSSSSKLKLSEKAVNNDVSGFKVLDLKSINYTNNIGNGSDSSRKSSNSDSSNKSENTSSNSNTKKTSSRSESESNSGKSSHNKNKSNKLERHVLEKDLHEERLLKKDSLKEDSDKNEESFSGDDSDDDYFEGHDSSFHTSVSSDDKYLRIIALDIETSFEGNMPDVNKDKIISVSLYSKNLKRVFMLKNDNSKLDYVVFCKSERELLINLRDEIKSYNPDFILGYNSDNFDFNYILHRCKVNHVDFDIGFASSVPRVLPGSMSSVKIKGIAHIDLYRFVRNVVARSLSVKSLGLNDVASAILNDGKYDLNYDDMMSLWNSSENLDSIAKYNLQDSKITYEIGMKLLPQIFELSRLIGVPPYSVTRMSFSQFVEWYFIRKAVREGILVPNRAGKDELKKRMREKYQGAFVFKPSAGLYDNIIVFDFKSLYPTIIVSHNISPETYNVESDENNKIYVPLESKDVNDSKKSRYWFIKRPKGFIAKYLEYIINKRTEVKSLMKNVKDAVKYTQLYARQLSLKTIANSTYGYLGFYLSRWYCLDCAKSVTALGRYYIKKVIASAQANGFKVIYSDTDSVFISLGLNKSRKEALNFLNEVNKSLPGIMHLDYEGFFVKGLFVALKSTDSGAKKKYALVDENGELVIKGFESVRRNWSILGKEVQKNVLKMILVDSNPDAALDYVKSVIADLRKGEIDEKKLVITTKLKKAISDYDSVGPHVAAAVKMKEKGIAVGPGSIIKYIIVKGNGPIRDKVVILSDYVSGSFDADYYINNQIVPSVKQIFEALGYSKDDFLGDKKQKSLNSFFTK